ncbi:hypothetical protein GCM10009827_106110 [Dactylosporangium maewongense]|uniref:Uncharacterized protein n=1 Tax=Dactylosporangium maewongense TaxID=634393 RepID=A0ABP4NSZ1_9ACTN
MGGDALGSDPGQMGVDAAPQLVVAAAGEGGAVAVSQQRIGGQDRAADGGVLGETGGELGADGLPADRAALLAQLQEAAFDVEVLESQPQGAASSASGSVCRRSRSASRMVSLPVVRATRLISVSSAGVSARRVLGSRRGSRTRWAGLSAAGMRASAMAWL